MCCTSALLASSIVLLCASTAAAGLVPGVGVVRVYYQSSWTTPHMHYNDGNSWTTPPGPAMVKSDNSSFPGWWMTTVAANQLTFVLNDGGNQWDNDGGKNFVASEPGVYSLQAFKKLQTVQTFARGCPLACSGHGTCSGAPSFKCTCEGGASGPSCSCSAGACGDHGECDAQGECTCKAPFATCSAGHDCATDVSSDPENCGACFSKCSAAAEGVLYAKCAASKCNITCKGGYVLCPTVETGVSSCVAGAECPQPPLPGCDTFAEGRCLAKEIDVDPKLADRIWFTPRPGDADYQDSFGDYWRLVAHAHVEYDTLRTTAIVSVIAIHKDNASLKYEFGGQPATSDNSVKLTSATSAGPLTVRVVASDGASLRLQDVDLLWSAPAIAPRPGDYRNGQKGAIVELFGWPHKDIEEECADAAKAGWLGLKVFPMQEQVMSLQPFNDNLNPWYFMYQPVSYRFEGRMGSHQDLRNMIYTCRKLGVRVYADAVVNHMVGGGNDINPHHRNFAQGKCTYWPNKNSSAESMSPFYTSGFTYTRNEHTGKNPMQEFPAVPYGPLDFHCERPCDSWADGRVLNSGWLTGLTDLHTGRDNVRERIADYLTSLISIGFSGFRIDAAKHICPDDLTAIFAKVRRNLGGAFPEDFISWLEVLLGGEAPLLIANADSDYSYGKGLQDKLLAAGLSMGDVNKIKIWYSAYPDDPGVDHGAISQVREAIQNDDADQQNAGSTSRDMHEHGSVFIKDRNVEAHRNFEIRLFKNPSGVLDNENSWPIRLLLSSYFWGNNGAAVGIPDGKSDCSLCKYTCESCHGMPFSKARDGGSCGYDTAVYTRTHRDKAVINAMREWMHIGASNSNEQLGLPAHC